MQHCGELLIFFLSSCILQWPLLRQITAQPTFVENDCSVDSYTANSTFRGNLDRVMSDLTTNASNSVGFYNTSNGENPDTVYGLFLCRGDITARECYQCIEIANGNITQNCPNGKAATLWYDLCMLRYSNHYIFSTLQYDVLIETSYVNSTTYPSQFIQIVKDLLDSLVKQAVNSTRKYADGTRNYTSSIQIYGLVQCTPDLSQYDCTTCFGILESSLIGIHTDSRGFSLTQSCSMKFDTYQFYESNASPAPAPSPLASPSSIAAPVPAAPSLAANQSSIAAQVPASQSHPPNSSGKRKIVIITVVLAIITAVILVSVISICFFKRKRKSEVEDFDEISMVQSLQFNFDTIRAATSNFSDFNKLGQGGFGPVYKGKLLNGQEVAVKRLSRDSGQGELEFKNEVVLVAKLQHKNLVRLLGFSLQGEEKLLIYEFLPNTSLDYFIFDPIKRANLHWEIRHKIIRGIARGLLYLHEESRLKIIHRDLKASNVLLDEKMNPKISDFGMARLFEVDQTQNTNRIVGTYGYMAPEYAMHGFFSVKSDVFSFGVLLLEIVSGRKNNSFFQLEYTEDLLSYAWRNWRENTVLEFMDTTLRGKCSISDVMQCMHIGLLCVQENAADRPTMASVDLMFNSSSITLSTPSPPAFSIYNTREADKSSTENDWKVMEQVPSTTKSAQRSTSGESSIELA